MTHDQHNGVTIVTVTGNLGGEEASHVRRALERAAEERPPGSSGGAVVDLERCPFIASDGLEALLAALKAAETRAIPLKLIRVGANCRTILQLTRLDHRFDCCDDLATALKGIN